MHVVMADVDEDNLRLHARPPAAQGADVLAVTADVRDPDAVERVGGLPSSASGSSTWQ